jgi:flagellin-like protein
MLLLIIILLLLFGGGGGYWGYSRWGRNGGMGIVGTVVLIAVILYLVGGLR